MVDNGSTDGALDGVGSRWPRLTLHVERLVENRGFAAANNLGARLVQGHWLALLNSDAFPDPDWLEKLLQAAERYLEFPFFASRQLQANAPHLLDGAGDAVHISGLASVCRFPGCSIWIGNRRGVQPMCRGCAVSAPGVLASGQV